MSAKILICRLREEVWWFLERRIERDAFAAFVTRRRYKAQNDRTLLMAGKRAEDQG